ncbi:MAG: hypothetical protein L3J07_02650 [Candidatus Magasanikbacteria bacterium]|nr:hypothetical protein [Candidatus Magasanikbacteria bacterium]
MKDKFIKKKLFKITVLKHNIIKVVYIKTKLNNIEDPKKAEILNEKIQAILSKKSNEKFIFILDVRPLGKNTNFSKETVAIYKKILKEKQFKKIAIIDSVGRKMHPFSGYIVSFLGFLSKSRKIRWFTKYDEVKVWLKI